MEKTTRITWWEKPALLCACHLFGFSQLLKIEVGFREIQQKNILFGIRDVIKFKDFIKSINIGSFPLHGKSSPHHKISADGLFRGCSLALCPFWCLLRPFLTAFSECALLWSADSRKAQLRVDQMGPKSIKHLNMCLAVDASLTAAQLPGKQGALGCCTEQNTAQGLFAHKRGSPSELEVHLWSYMHSQVWEDLQPLRQWLWSNQLK